METPAKNPDGIDPNVGKLEELEKMVSAIADLKRTRGRISIFGILIIFALIMLFLYNIVSFFSNYDTTALASSIQDNVQNIADSPEFADLASNVKDYMIPKFRDELIKKVEADIPKFKEDGNRLLNDLQQYVQKDLNNKLLNELTSSLNEIEREMVKSHPNINSVKIDAILKDAQKVFVEELGQRLEKRLETATDHLVALNSSFEKLANSEEFRGFTPENQAELEAKLLEAVLELAIYHVNPNRGNEPAFAIGGDK